MKSIQLPLEPAQVLELSVGEQVSVSGVIFTSREATARHLQSGVPLPEDCAGSFLYHCGPVGRKTGKRWKVTSLAPDPSPAFDRYQSAMLSRYRFRGVIGTGGMGPEMLTACRRFIACYLQTVGSAGLALANYVAKVRDVHLREELEVRDAVWEIEVQDFPCVVTMDAHGRNLHSIVRDLSTRRLAEIHD